MGSSGPKQQCMDGFLMTDGIEKLNARAVSVINKQRKPVSVVNGFDITREQCDDTPAGDGRHYKNLVFTELSQLWETLFTSSKTSDKSYLNEMGCGVDRWRPLEADDE